MLRPSLLSGIFIAGLFCTEPREPFCLNGMHLNSEADFDDCRFDVENYGKKLQDYLECTQEDATTKYKKAINKFNCYASGETLCF